MQKSHNVHSSETEAIGAEARLDVPRLVAHEDIAVGTPLHERRLFNVERVDDDRFDKLVRELRATAGQYREGSDGRGSGLT